MPKKRIVIVEDEADMADLVAARLRQEGYTVELAADGEEALRKIHAAPPDLVLTDVMLPRRSGTELATELRHDPRTANIPIIMLTARSEESDVIVGLRLGADDYITKPFNMSVLVARIEAVLRRVHEDAAARTCLQAGPIRIDLERHSVEIGKRTIDLTLTEFRLLTALVVAKGRVLSRNQLIDQAMGVDAIVTDRTIDVHLTALRHKLQSARSFIQTVRGVGYRLAAETHEGERPA